MRADLLVMMAAVLVLPIDAGVPAAWARQSGTAHLSGMPRDVACAPAASAMKPAATLVIAGGRDLRKTLFGPGDPVILTGGTAHGVRVGAEYYVRRLVADQFTEAIPGTTAPYSVHTAGMVRILETETGSAVAVVTYGCDGILEGDYLEPFQAPALPSAGAAGTPDFAHPGRVVLGDDRRQMGGTGEFMVLDRGSDHGIRAGQRVSIFRHAVTGSGGPVTTVGTATVYVVRPETSTLRIDGSVDAVYVGDLVAIHR